MTAKKFTREALWQAPRFAQYQQDFLRAVLHKPQYTLAEAESAVKAFFEKGADSHERRDLDHAK